MSTLADANIFTPSASIVSPVYMAGFVSAPIGIYRGKNSKARTHANPDDT